MAENLRKCLIASQKTKNDRSVAQKDPLLGSRIIPKLRITDSTTGSFSSKGEMEKLAEERKDETV